MFIGKPCDLKDTRAGKRFSGMAEGLMLEPCFRRCIDGIFEQIVLSPHADAV